MDSGGYCSSARRNLRGRRHSPGLCCSILRKLLAALGTFPSISMSISHKYTLELVKSLALSRSDTIPSPLLFCCRRGWLRPFCQPVPVDLIRAQSCLLVMHSLVLVVVSDVLSALSHPQHCYMLHRVADIYSSHLAATYLPVGAHSSSNLKFTELHRHPVLAHKSRLVRLKTLTIILARTGYTTTFSVDSAASQLSHPEFGAIHTTHTCTRRSVNPTKAPGS